MTEIKVLINAVQENTQAQQALAKAISELAASNRDIVDYLIAEETEEGKEPATYLDGTPKEL